MPPPPHHFIYLFIYFETQANSKNFIFDIIKINIECRITIKPHKNRIWGNQVVQYFLMFLNKVWTLICIQ